MSSIRMRIVRRIAQTELSVLFISPVAWLLIAVFSIDCGLTLSSLMDDRLSTELVGSALYESLTDAIFQSRSGVLPTAMGRLHLYIPLITMSLISRESQSGSIKLLQSSPVEVLEIVFGKYLALVSYVVAMTAVLIAYMLIGGTIVENLDYAAILSGILGIFLLACTYGAIGLFMSSLSPYPAVAAIATLAALSLLNVVGTLGQDIPVVGEITNWLDFGRRGAAFTLGLVETKNIFYFLCIIGMFLGFTALKLSAGRTVEDGAVRIVKYVAVFLLAVAIGRVSAIPAITAHYDLTRGKYNSLSPESENVVSRMAGVWTITTYVNVLSRSLPRFLPARRRINTKFMNRYSRVHPEIHYEYVYYYGSVDNPDLYKRFPDKSDREIAQVVVDEHFGLDIEEVLSPDEIERVVEADAIGSWPHRVIEWRGRVAHLGFYSSWPIDPVESEITSALSRMLIGPSTIAFTAGHGERGVHAKGDADYFLALSAPRRREALIGQGFDLEPVDLRFPIRQTVDILLIADPKTAFSAEEAAHIQNYVARGGNAIIVAEPGRQNILHNVLSPLAVSLSSTQGAGVDSESGGTSTAAGYSNEAPASFYYPPGRDHEPILLDRSVSVGVLPDSSFTATPILVYESDNISRSLGVGLTRQVNGREQRIVVVGDADFMGNAAIASIKRINAMNAEFVLQLFSWLSYEKYPPPITIVEFQDTHLKIDKSGVKLLRYAIFGFVPLFFLSIAAVIHYRRRRR